MDMGPLFGFRNDVQQWEQLKQYDPEMYQLEMSDQQLEREIAGLTQQLRRAPREKRDELKIQIKQLVEKHFDVRQSRRQLHVKRLQEDLEKLKQAIDRRNELRPQVIERRVAELVGEESALDF
jgi:replicative DNA helicase